MVAHILPRAAFAVVAKAPYPALEKGCAHKKWDNLALYSAAESTLGEDLGVSFTEDSDSRFYNYKVALPRLRVRVTGSLCVCALHGW